MQRETSQRDAERIASGVGFFVMVFATLTFLLTPATAVFARLSHDLGLEVTPRFFAAGCIVGALLMGWLFMLPDVAALWKRTAYFIATLPILTYAIPVGWVTLRTGGNGLSPVLLLLFYALIMALMLTTYRGGSNGLPSSG